jgi:uncharacterized damage-inducible protein DinB
MNGPAAIQLALKSTQFLLGEYLKDLSDADLLLRPVPGANNIAWQLGHLITSERVLVTAELPNAAYPELPAGFAEAHAKATANADGPAGFRTRDEYLSLLRATREATVAAVGGLTDADLDRAAVGPLAKVAPTLGATLILVSNHTLMHGGQITVVRRKLGKPVLF